MFNVKILTTILSIYETVNIRRSQLVYDKCKQLFWLQWNEIFNIVNKHVCRHSDFFDFCALLDYYEILEWWVWRVTDTPIFIAYIFLCNKIMNARSAVLCNRLWRGFNQIVFLISFIGKDFHFLTV